MNEELQSFLMVGQSNMAGRGYLKDVSPIYDEQIKVLINGRWQTMNEPINKDRPTSGVGLAASFAGAWRLKNPDGQIGLIPCADGGSSLDEWAIGEALYTNAVSQAKLSQRIGLLKGILWHQGENDSAGGRSEYYYDKLAVIVAGFREELQVPDIPFVVGGLGDFLITGSYGEYFTEYISVNNALFQFASTIPNSYFVTASGLTANDDKIHFDAISQRKLGVRYFEAWSNRENVLYPLDTENETIDIIEKGI